MKNFKFLSALALTGMLSAEMAGIVFAAGTTKMHGEYHGELRTLKTPAVAFSLTDNTDVLTVDEILLQGGYKSLKLNGSTVDGATAVKTGDYITTDGTSEKKDVVIYGDVDGSKDVSVEDVVYASKISAGIAPEGTTTVQREAADVENDGEITIEDVVRISKFSAGITGVDTAVNVPTPTQKEEKYQYTMIVNGNNIINNVNEKSTTIELDKKVETVDGETLRLEVYYAKASSMLKEARATSKTVTIDTSTGKIKLSNISDFSDLEDGNLYFRLYKVKGSGVNEVATLLNETVVEKTTDLVPQIAEVTAKRDGTNNVVFAGTRYGESDIQTIYYCAVPADVNNGTLAWNPTSKQFTASNITGYTAVTSTIEVNGANSVNKTLPGLSTEHAYNLFYVLENKKGSQSVHQSKTENMSSLTKDVAYVEVAKDKDVRVEKEVTDLKYDKTTKKFTWNKQGNNGFIVTLYDSQNNVVAVDDSKSSSDPAEYTLDLSKATELGLGKGEYYIKVVTKGATGATTVNSEAVKSSNTVKIGQIAPITNVKYVMDETTGYPKLTWDENDQNCGGEKLTFKMDMNNDDGLTKDTSVAVKTKASYTEPITSFQLGVDAVFGGKDSVWEYQSGSNSYQNNCNALNRANSVSMVATAKSTVAEGDDTAFYLDSEPTEFNFYIPYRKATVKSSTDVSVLLNMDLSQSTTTYHDDAKSLVYGAKLEDYTYQVRVYTSDGTYIKTATPKTHYDDTNKNGKYDESETLYFTIDNLAANTDYKFRLVTKCGEFESWSKLTDKIRTMPKIQGLTKAESEDKCTPGSKTFFVSADGKNLTVEGTTYKAEDYPMVVENLNQSQVTDLNYFLNQLNAGDIVTISGDNIDLELNTKSSNSSGILSGRYLKDKIVTLTGSDYEYKLKTETGNLPKEVHIKSGQFNITDLEVNPKEGIITLGNGSVVTTEKADQKLTIEAGATVTINGLKITTTTKENVVKIAAKNTIEIVANNNTLTFENVSTKVNAEDIPNEITIKFVSGDGNHAVQQGSITIVNGEESAAKIVVTQENVTVEGGLTVNVEKGEVDVSDVNITSSKSVTLSKDATITARSELDAPEQLIGTTVTIRNYADKDDLRNEFKDDASKGYEITPEILANINTWLASFGINDKGAKVTVGSENKVTISYAGSETLQVQGLK